MGKSSLAECKIGNTSLKKRLLFLSFYYPPDLSAGSFRSKALVKEFIVQAGAGWDIDILTTMPNRYCSLSSEAALVEQVDGLKVQRILLPAHQSGMRDQSLAFVAYARNVRRAIKGNHYDMVFATTSRLATGVLGARIASRRRIPLYLDMRDIFSDTMEDVLKDSALRILLPAIRLAEKYAVGHACKVNVVSGGFLPYFEEHGLANGFSIFPNGIDDEFLGVDFSKQIDDKAKKVILYAGNIGKGQGLHRVVPELAQRLDGDWLVRIVGDGGMLGALKSELTRKGIDNVELMAPVPRCELIDHYRQADVLFLHLNDYKAFRRVLPSKIFEYAATSKPILAGVGGYAATFLQENVPNVAIFPPCNAKAGADALHNLCLFNVPREQFVSKYSRHAIAMEMIADILKMYASFKLERVKNS